MRYLRHHAISWRLAPLACISVVAGVIVCLTCCRPASAQFKPPSTPSLSDFSSHLDWNASEKGPLLLIAADRLRPAYPPYLRDDKGAILLRPPETTADGEFSTLAVATYCQAHIAAVGTLSAIVPDDMTVLSYRDLPPPDLTQGVSRADLPQYLLAALSPKQWEQLCQPDGVTYADLTDEQRSIWRAIFPPEVKVTHDEDPQSPGVSVDVEAPHLRLQRYISANLIAADGSGASVLPPEEAAGASGQQVFLHYPGDEISVAASWNHAAYGANLIQMLPNRIKKSDLDYADARLHRSVTLRDARTVQDLLDRVRAATGLRLVADVRYAELPVTSLGGEASVSAGDLLKAIALSVTGTYRRLESSGGPVYLLTDDLVGLGTREIAILRWLQGADMASLTRDESIRDGVVQSRASDHAGWAVDALAPSDALKAKLADLDRRLDAGKVDPKWWDSIAVPVGELAPAMQEAVQRSRSEYAKASGPGSSNAYKPDVVEVSETVKLSIEIPNVGTIEPEGANRILGPFGNYHVASLVAALANRLYQNGNAPLPVEIDPAVASERGIAVTPKSEAEAAEWARLAVRKGWNRLFLSINGDTDPETVGLWAKAAHREAPGVAIYVELRPLRVAPKATDGDAGGDRDINLLGETESEMARHRALQIRELVGGRSLALLGGAGSLTMTRNTYLATEKRGDYLALTSPAVQARVTDQIAAIQRQAGDSVQGVVLSDLFPTGYDRFPSTTAFRMLGELGDENLGYSPDTRADFLESFGVDPIDITSTPVRSMTQYVSIALPYFPDIVSVTDNKHYPPDPDHPNPPHAELGQKWREYRYQIAESFRKSLLDKLSDLGVTDILLATPSAGRLDGFVAASERLRAEQEPAKAQNGAVIPAKGPWNRFVFDFAYSPAGENPSDGATAAQRFARQFAAFLPEFVRGSTKLPSAHLGGFVLDLTDVQDPNEGERLLEDLVVSAKRDNASQ